MPLFYQIGDARRLGAVAEDGDAPFQQAAAEGDQKGAAGQRNAGEPDQRRLERQVAVIGQMLEPRPPIRGRGQHQHQHEHKGDGDLAEQQAEIDKALFAVEANRDHGRDRGDRQARGKLSRKGRDAKYQRGSPARLRQHLVKCASDQQGVQRHQQHDRNRDKMSEQSELHHKLKFR